MPQYYLDSPNFATATAVYANATLTVLAPDGYYSSNGIVRSQVGGQLSAYAECESCKEYQKPVEGELLLDLYPGAVAAFSLNQLSTPYTGAAVRVRRASDSVEQDIGFTSEFVLDVAALDSFCSGTDGFVVTWYNQDGSGNDLEQATTANQPKIYDSTNGVIEDGSAGNEKPAIDWNGSSHQLIASVTISAALASTSFVVANPDVVSGNRRIYNMHDGATGDERNSSFVNSQFNIFDGTNGILAGSPSAGEQYIITSRFVTGDGTIHANGTLQVTSAAIAQKAITTLSIGKQDVGAAFYFDGKIQAVIIYTADKSADRAGIENALNQQYNIYWDGTVTALLDDYPGAVGAFSVRALNSFYTGPIMRVRRSSDSAEQDIKALYSGDLDRSALATFCAGTNGFVVTWYDQSGEGNDATQTTTSAQPKIYDASTGVELENGKATLKFSSATRLIATNLSGLSGKSQSFFNVALTTTTTSANKPEFFYMVGASSPTAGTTRGLTQELYLRFESATQDYNSYHNYGNQKLYSLVCPGTVVTIDDYDLYRNGSLLTPDSLSGSTVNDINAGVLAIGCNTGESVGTFLQGNQQALIIYNTDKSADRAAIETALNDYFNIY